jgi:hypothetical protein
MTWRRSLKALTAILGKATLRPVIGGATAEQELEISKLMDLRSYQIPWKRSAVGRSRRRSEDDPVAVCHILKLQVHILGT